MRWLGHPHGASDSRTSFLATAISLEFAAGSGLVEADAAGGDVRLEIVFAFDGAAGEAAEHGDLADVVERVGDGALEKAFGWRVERFGGCQVIVDFFHRRKKAIDFGIPGQRCRVMPNLLALRDRDRPIEKIAQVREDLRGRACLVADGEAGERIRSAAQCFAAAVGNRGDGVAKQLPCGIGRSSHAVIPFSSESYTVRIIDGQGKEERVLTQRRGGRREKDEAGRAEARPLHFGVDADVVDEHLLREDGGVVRRAGPIAADGNI
jgi:hypothetical protein